MIDSHKTTRGHRAAKATFKTIRAMQRATCAEWFGCPVPANRNTAWGVVPNLFWPLGDLKGQQFVILPT